MARIPCKDANVQSLDWARRNGLLSPSWFSASELLENVSKTRDISLIAYLCNTYKITMESMITCVYRVLKSFCKYNDQFATATYLSYLEPRIQMVHVKRLLELYDNNAAKFSGYRRNFVKFDLYDKMLDKLYSFADLLLYFPSRRDDFKFLMDWHDKKREEKEEYLEGEMYFN